MSETYCIANAVLFGILLNLMLPHLFLTTATPEEINPPNGASNLPFQSQIVHMMVHHHQVPLTSSLIIALLVALSVFLGYYFKPVEKIMKLISTKK